MRGGSLRNADMIPYTYTIYIYNITYLCINNNDIIITTLLGTLNAEMQSNHKFVN